MKTNDQIFEEHYKVWTNSDKDLKSHMLDAMTEYADQEKQALRDKIGELLRFESSLRLIMKENLQSPDNFLKALEALNAETLK